EEELAALAQRMAEGDERAYDAYSRAEARLEHAGGWNWRDRALGLLHRTAPAAEAEAAALALAREVAGHAPEGVRALKALFRELTGSAAHVAAENVLLVDTQRGGGGLKSSP
ncbi:MAG: hypothetical protein H0U33_04365, partial [Solirubrobacterales bacterium]|nr:hypothetical protein [Solirubrobacterales bacterium]